MCMVSVMVEVMVMVTIDDTFSFFLSQPVDVSHIYVANLHERQQKRLAKNNNTKMANKVRSETERRYLLTFSMLFGKLVFQIIPRCQGLHFISSSQKQVILSAKNQIQLGNSHLNARFETDSECRFRVALHHSFQRSLAR